MTNTTEKLMGKASAFHGHVCGGLAIGVKACEALGEFWNLNLSDSQVPNSTLKEKIVCVAENDSCSIDAIQSILGCTLGSGTLFVNNVGKQAFSFFDRESQKSLRICLNVNFDSIPKEERKNIILATPIRSLFKYSEPNIAVPRRAKIFRNARCERCLEYSAESYIRLYGGKLVCAECYRILRDSENI